MRLRTGWAVSELKLAALVIELDSVLHQEVLDLVRTKNLSLFCLIAAIMTAILPILVILPILRLVRA